MCFNNRLLVWPEVVVAVNHEMRKNTRMVILLGSAMSRHGFGRNTLKQREFRKVVPDASEMRVGNGVRVELTAVIESQRSLRPGQREFAEEPPPFADSKFSSPFRPIKLIHQLPA
jgi:hypothetical protein